MEGEEAPLLPPPQVIRRPPLLSSPLLTPETAEMTQQGVFFPCLSQIPQVSRGFESNPTGSLRRCRRRKTQAGACPQGALGYM